MIEVSIPVLNEERRLRSGVERLAEALSNLGHQPQIAIADNGSEDSTPEIARQICAEIEGVRYLRVPGRGVGRALKAAWSSSAAEWVGYVDVDHSTDLSHLKVVFDCAHASTAQILSGSRLLPGSKVEGRRWQRELASRAFNALLKLRLGVHFSDGMCGFKFLRRDLFEKIQNHWSPLSDGWFFNTEILVKAEWSGASVTDLPVHWTDDPDSRVKILALSWEYLQEIERLRKERTRHGL